MKKTWCTTQMTSDGLPASQPLQYFKNFHESSSDNTHTWRRLRRSARRQVVLVLRRRMILGNLFSSPTCFNYDEKSQKIKKRFGNARRNLFEVSWVTGARGTEEYRLLIWPSLVPKWHQGHTEIIRICVLTEPPPSELMWGTTPAAKAILFKFARARANKLQQSPVEIQQNMDEALSKASIPGPCPPLALAI